LVNFEAIANKHVKNETGRGFAVSLEREGRPLFKYFSGTAELGSETYPVTENAPFDVGSVAKQFVACCAAILARENKLCLSDPIRKYLPEMGGYADKITIRHLISMTSGVRNVYLMKYLMSDSPLGEMEMFFRQRQPANGPGNFWGYGEADYILLGHVVERLTGGNAGFANERIFKPLGMKDTRGYGIMGGGGLFSTVRDLHLWFECLAERNLPGAPAGLFDMIFSPHTMNCGEVCPYGFGFFYDGAERDIIWQYGDMNDWQCVVRLYLKRRLSIVVLTYQKNNGFEPVGLALELENEAARELFGLPERGNYKRAYFERPLRQSETERVFHPDYPDAVKQNPHADENKTKYFGRYYGYEIDTRFEIVPDGSGFQMKYAGRGAEGFVNLLSFSGEGEITATTRGEWGSFRFPLEFFGSGEKIDYFTLRRGAGHFYFTREA